MTYHAGLRPRITAEVASLMSVSIDLDSDSSSDEEEEEPILVKKHKSKAHQPSLLYVMQAVQCIFAHGVKSPWTKHELRSIASALNQLGL